MSSDPQFQFGRPSMDREKLKREFQKLALADKNIRTALYTCNAFIELIMKWEEKALPFEVADAFIGAIVMAYSCPFTDNNGIGTLLRKWREFDSLELKQTHEEILRLRNDKFAHTDTDVHEITIIPNGCLPTDIGPKPPQVAYKISGLLIPPQNVTRYRTVCFDLQSRLEKEAQKALAALYEGMELPTRSFPLRFTVGL
jgi:hypothetical protein